MTKEQKEHNMRMLAFTVIRNLLDALDGKVDAVSFTERARAAALDLGLIVINDDGWMRGVVVTEGEDSRPTWYL